MKKILAVMLVAVFVLSTLAFTDSAHAWGKWGRKKCESKWSMEEKVMNKAKFMMKYEDEVGLSEEQVEKIKEIKMDTKKDLIKKKAEIDVVKVDIKSMLYDDKIDLDAVNQLIDKKYDLKKSKSKMLVKAYADLKSIPTDEQMAKMKEIWKKHYKK